VRADWHAPLFPLYGDGSETSLARLNPIHKPTFLQLVKDTTQLSAPQRVWVKHSSHGLVSKSCLI
jgi:hypothetical protein